MSVREAMESEHHSDAHMTLYSLKDADGSILEAIPLLTKHILKQVRQAGGDILLNAIALDWDCPGHIPLTPELLRDFLSKFLTACAMDERLGRWACIHSTRHGCRVVYELASPIPADIGEQYIVSVIKEFKKHDIPFDPSTKDWTRRFRLPKVVRDGLHTKDEPVFYIQTQEVTLDVKQFKKADINSLAVVIDYEKKGTYPPQEECNDILYEKGQQGRARQTEYFKKAKSLIKSSTPYYDNLFSSEAPMCGSTGRNDFFCKMLGLIIPKMLDRFRATPEQIFALLSDPLHELEPIAGKQDPSQHCWNLLQDIYEREFEKYKVREEKKAQLVEEGQTALERMADGMRQWCDAEELFDEDSSVVEEFVKGHLFANVSQFYYPMDEDGWYGSVCLMRHQLVARIRKTFLAGIVDTEKQGRDGEPTSVSPIEIMDRYSTVVNEVRMSPLQGSKGRIDNLDGDKPVLVLPMYQRNEFLPAEFNGAVDGWLKALFGRHYFEASKWIAYALDFEAGPICAISISGSGSVGKKMFVEGLAECLVDPWTATGHDMCGNENGAILRTPFLVVNEGMPKTRDMSPSDTFKSLTAGDPIRVRELYKPSVNVINPMRLIFTANDHAVLQEISKGKELTPQTRKAMGERLLHFDVGPEAEAHLKRLGGRTYTEKEGARWIRGDSGQPSDFIVAKHFMWMYRNRERMFPRNATDRYCVMGNCNEAESFQLASQSEHLPAVIRGIVGLCERPGSLKIHRILSSSGNLYVTVQGVLVYIREVNQEQVSERAMEGVLKSLMKDSTPYDRDGLIYKRLDPGAILDWAKPRGLPCATIDKLHRISMSKGEKR